MTDGPVGPTEVPNLGTLSESVEIVAQSGMPKVPGYELLDELGRGGMGIVYKARQLKLNRLVALKMLPGGWQSDPDLFARFRAEAEAVAKLQHPNIVQIFEVGDAGGQPFLALEYVPGGTLAAFLARKPQPAESAAIMVRSLAGAVQHAHEQGILHRDLKPGNILIAERRTPGETAEPTADAGKVAPKSGRDVCSATAGVGPLKVTDFGLAKHVNASDGPTQPGDVIGTPSYMAPEQAGGVTLRPTAALDVYALGAVLYEMLTGRPPFLGATPTETVVQVLSQDPVPPRQLRPDCPRDLETICLKCLEKNPSKRYQRASDLAEELRRWIAGEPIVARRAGQLERLVKWSRRNPSAAAACVAGVVLMAVGILYGVQLARHNRQLRESEDEQRIARARAEANFQIARQAVKDLLADVGSEELQSVPHMDSVRRSLLRKALGAMQTLLGQDRENPDVRRELAQVLGDAGEVHEMLGEGADAERHFRESIALYRALGDDPHVARERALAVFRLASLLASNGRGNEAEPVFDDALRQLDGALMKGSNDPELIYMRCRVLLNRGPMYGQLGRTREAERDMMTARDELIALVHEHPGRKEFRERLAVAHNNLGVQYREAGRLKDAALAYFAAVEQLKALVDQNPAERSFRSRLSIASRNLGSAYWWSGENVGAEAALRFSVEVARQCDRAFPGVPEYRHNLALSQENLGEMLDYDGKPEGQPLCREAMAIKQQLLAAQPGFPDFVGSLGYSFSLQAVSCHRRHDPRTAAQWEQRAIDQFKRAIVPNANNQRFRVYLQAELRKHTRTLMECDAVREAARSAEESANVFPDRASDALDAAIALGECAQRATGLEQWEYLHRATHLLQRAARSDAVLEQLGSDSLATLRRTSAFWDTTADR